MTKLLILLNLGLLLVACGGGGSAKNTSPASSASVLISSSGSQASSSGSQASATSTSPASSPSAASTSSKMASASSQLLAYGSNSMQIGELRLPAGQAKPPLVVIIHGGCWVSSYANYTLMDSLARAITELGYASWNIEYRAIGTGGEWPVIFQDVGRALDFARGFASYGVDTSKVAVIGHSAGGHLALWAASRHKLPVDSAIYTENPLPLRGVISLAGIADVTASNSCGTLADKVIGLPTQSPGANLNARLQQTSPQQMLPIGVPSLVLSGSRDGIVPPAMGNNYTTAASSQGDASLHYVLQPLGHFELIDPAATNWALYQQALANFFKD